MTNPYPPPPKRLVRSTSSRVVGGVCGGVADYLNMDPNLVRILTVLITLFTGIPVILYIVALFVVPEDTAAPAAPPPGVTGPAGYAGPFAGGQSAPPAPAYAPYPGSAPAADEAVWGTEGPPWEQRPSEPTPAPAAARVTPAPEPAAPSEPEAPVVPPAEPRPEDPPKP